MDGLTGLTNLSNLIGKSAPLIATMLGSPVAGIGVSWLASLFGGNPKDTQALFDKISADPGAEMKLKALEHQHHEELLKIASLDYQTEVDDRKSARQREISLHDFVPTILAIGFLVIYSAIQFYCVTHENSTNDIISARSQDILIMIISYYFGSSHSLRKGRPPQS